MNELINSFIHSFMNSVLIFMGFVFKHSLKFQNLSGVPVNWHTYEPEFSEMCDFSKNDCFIPRGYPEACLLKYTWILNLILQSLLRPCLICWMSTGSWHRGVTDQAMQWDVMWKWPQPYLT